MSWRSKKILERPEWSMHRSLYKSMGYSDYDLERPYDRHCELLEPGGTGAL